LGKRSSGERVWTVSLDNDDKPQKVCCWLDR